MDFFQHGCEIRDTGTYFQLAEAHPVLTQAEVVAVARQRDAARQAAELELAEQKERELVLANMRLVTKVAYAWQSELHLLERLQFGYDGLLAAAHGFMWEFGVRFSTYAGTCIRRHISKGVHQAPNERGARYWEPDERRHLDKVEGLLMQRLRREPSAEELAQEMGWTVVHVRRLQRLFSAPPPLEDDWDPRAGNVLIRRRNLHELSPEEVVLLDERMRLGAEALERADQRTRGYFRRRWGFDHPDGDEESASQIGKSEGITDEAVNAAMKAERRGVLEPFLRRQGIGPEILDDSPVMPWHKG